MGGKERLRSLTANKKPGANAPGPVVAEVSKAAQAESDFTRWARRETFRDAVLE